MRKLIIAIVLIVLSVLIVSCSNSEGGSDLENGNHLHYILPPSEYDLPFIGDVHPFYDEISDTWYLFYLDTSGQYNSRLLVSKNGINWTPREFKVHSGFANYAVLNVFKKDDQYFTYYADYQASVSDDLDNWYYAGGEYVIDRDAEQFPAGSRDPDVVYDAETDRFYSISINYVSTSNGHVSNLAIGATVGNDQTEWLETHRAVRDTPVVNSDYEVPQLVKMGDRWYIFASRYGQSAHGVGRTSYFIGDPGLNPYEVDWTTKEEHYLTTEDLAAAQVENKNDKFYIFGWIPRYYNNAHWGGFINLPTEVYQLPDGTLGTRLSTEIASEIRAELKDEIDSSVAISVVNNIELDITKRFDVEAYFSIETDSSVEISFTENNVTIAIERTESYERVTVAVGAYQTAEMYLRPDTLSGLNNIRIIGEGRNLEIFLNDTYSIVSRIEQEFRGGKIAFNSILGSGYLEEAQSYRLKFREELIEEGEE